MFRGVLEDEFMRNRKLTKISDVRGMSLVLSITGVLQIALPNRNLTIFTNKFTSIYKYTSSTSQLNVDKTRYGNFRRIINERSRQLF